MKNMFKLLPAVAVVVFASGCATNSTVDSVKLLADSAQQSANESLGGCWAPSSW